MTPRRPLVLLLALALLAASCSRGDEPLADPALTDLLEGTEAPSVDEGATTTLLPPTPTDPPAIEAPMFADRLIPCGPSSVITTDAIGVTADTITIGTGNDRGGLYAFNPGYGMPDAVRAMADVCNVHGGLTGRALVVHDYDAAVVEVADRAVEQCAEVAAQVGYGYLDALAAFDTWNTCEMPAFDGWYSPLVKPATRLLAAHRFASFTDPAAFAVAIVTPDTVAGEAEAAVLAGSFADGGFAVVADLRYSVLGPPDWADLAAQIGQAEAGLVHVEGGCVGAIVPLAAAVSAEDIDPVFVGDHRAYDAACVGDAASAGVGLPRLLLELPFLPVEDGDAAPATQAYVEEFERFVVPITGDALLAASAFWRFAAATTACPALQRACLTAAGPAQWDGLGLHPGPGEQACRVVVGVVDGAFERVLPTTPGAYECPADA